jgi:septal ring factor EnvC (AmiA/AmiB activator)
VEADTDEEEDYAAAEARWHRRRAATRRTWWVIAALFVLINGGALLGPRLLMRPERARLEKVRTILAGQEAYLNEQQTRLNAMRAEIANREKALTPLKAAIESLEKKNPKGVPAAEYPRYLLRVQDYNRQARSLNELNTKYQSALNLYRGDAAQHEQYVAEERDLARKINDAWPPFLRRPAADAGK